MPLVTKAKEFSEREIQTLTKSIRKRYREPFVRFEMKLTDKDGDDLHNVFTVEDPPRTLLTCYSSDSDGLTERYRITKPLSYLNVHFNKYGQYVGSIIFFSNKKIKDTTSAAKLLYVPLPNIGYDFNSAQVMGICMGNHTMPGSTLQEKALGYNVRFWASKFNDQMEFVNEASPFTRKHDDYDYRSLLEKWQNLTDQKRLPRFRVVRRAMGKSIRRAAEALRNALLGID